jgi:hypothetical protein
MKPSKRNIKNAHAQAERRSRGKPAVSKYAAKKGRGETTLTLTEAIAAHFNRNDRS